MDKEGRDPCNRVMLQKTKMVRVSLEPFMRIHTESQLTTAHLASQKECQVKSREQRKEKRTYVNRNAANRPETCA
jgi:hypothetical protein